jgi:hypothetical protein
MFSTKARSVRRDQLLLRINPPRATKPPFDPFIYSHEDKLVRVCWRRDSGRFVA